MENWKTVRKFSRSHNAHLAKILLENEEIPVILTGEYAKDVYVLDAVGSVDLLVPPEYYDRAVELLKETEDSDV